MAGKVIKSMTTYQRYVETAAKKAEEALGEVPRGPGQRSSPRLIQRLEEAEKKLKDQYNRIYERQTYLEGDLSRFRLPRNTGVC